MDTDIDRPTCEWFRDCFRPSAGTVEHPILGPVPCCTRCAEKLNLELDPYEEQDS